MNKFKKKVVSILGYEEVAVHVEGICVVLGVMEDGDTHSINLYREESKALRKALKKAEQAVVGVWN